MFITSYFIICYIKMNDFPITGLRTDLANITHIRRAKHQMVLLFWVCLHADVSDLYLKGLFYIKTFGMKTACLLWLNHKQSPLYFKKSFKVVLKVEKKKTVFSFCFLFSTAEIATCDDRFQTTRTQVGSRKSKKSLKQEGDTPGGNVNNSE